MKGYQIRLGNTALYADFPRGGYVLQNIICSICNNIIIEANDLKKGVEIIKKQKEDDNSDLNYYTSLLEKLGVKWYLRFSKTYKKPVIHFRMDKYFNSLWVLKLKRFINELNKGDDCIQSIYLKARSLTPTYSNIKIISKEKVEKPQCFEILFSSELSPYNEIKALAKILDGLYKIAKNVKHPLIKYSLLEVQIEDLKASVYTLKTLIDSGYVISGYNILRKILTSFSLFLFTHSIVRQTYKPDSKSDSKKYKNLHKKLIGDLEKFALNFPSEWKIVQFYGDFILVDSTWKVKHTSIEIPIPDFSTFINIRKRLLADKLIVVPKDKFLMELLDFLITNSIDVFNAKQINLSGDVLDEYKKLSEVLHDPVFVDFPPFSSIIEYLGFVHHLRKVRHILENALLSYNEILKNKHR